MGISSSLPVWAGIILSILLVGFVLLLWAIGLFDIPSTDAGVQAFAVVFALLGGLGTAALTFVGVLFKTSVDARTLQLQRESEDRLKMEACIQAVGLFSTSSGNEASPSQKAGALFALVNLGQLKLALILVDQMWPSGEITPASAVWIVGQGLECPEVEIQQHAADLLSDNAGSLKTSSGNLVWPSYIDSKWRPDIDVYAREFLIDALLKCVGSGSLETWQEDSLNQVIVNLYVMMTRDTHRPIIASATIALDVLLRLPQYHNMDIQFWEEPFNTYELRAQLAELPLDARDSIPNSTQRLVDDLIELLPST